MPCTVYEKEIQIQLECGPVVTIYLTAIGQDSILPDHGYNRCENIKRAETHSFFMTNQTQKSNMCH